MIKKIEVENFRCLKKASIDLARITLLTGANSAGKSTLLYALLGSLQAHDFPYTFAPNGEHINLGDYRDIIHQRNIDDDFRVNLVVSKKNYSDVHIETTWTSEKKSGMPLLLQSHIYCEEFDSVISHQDGKWNLDLTILSSESSSDRSRKQFREVTEYLFSTLGRESSKQTNMQGREPAYELRTPISISSNSANKLRTRVLAKYRANYDVFSAMQVIEGLFSEIKENFSYISPFRSHPERTYYQKTGSPKRVNRFGDGYIDQILSWHKDDKRKFDSFKTILRSMGLADSVAVKIMPGGRYQISVKTPKSKSFVNIVDTGFGISQFLPIIVSDLQLERKSLLLLSQPEIHLHPSVQADFAEYLCASSSIADKRYLVETHSEYLINRIRLLIVQGRIDPDDIRVYHFERTRDETLVHRLGLNKDGTISGAPKDFFETYLMDTLKIAMES